MQKILADVASLAGGLCRRVCYIEMLGVIVLAVGSIDDNMIGLTNLRCLYVVILFYSVVQLFSIDT